MESMGRIMEIKKETTQRMYGGIRGGRSYGRTPYGYYNGHGAFMEYPENHLYLVAYIYETKQVVYIDIRDWVLEESGRCRITQGYLNYLKNENEGKKIWFEDDCDGDWDLQDYDDLDY